MGKSKILSCLGWEKPLKDIKHPDDSKNWERYIHRICKEHYKPAIIELMSKHNIAVKSCKLFPTKKEDLEYKEWFENQIDEVTTELTFGVEFFEDIEDEKYNRAKDLLAGFVGGVLARPRA